MESPPDIVCPRIMLTDTMINDAERWIFYSTIRGLYDKKVNGERLITWSKFIELKNTVENYGEAVERISELDLPLTFDVEEFWENKRIGLQGEMAFHISRKADPTIAFNVAKSYAFRGAFERVYPDACLDASKPISGFCRDSKKINVKTRRRQESNARVGLRIKDKDWKKWMKFKDDAFYVAVSRRRRHNFPYDVLDYTVLGYALKEEIKNTQPNRGYRFIHFYDLHPIDCLAPSSCKTDETVHSRLFGW